MSRGRPTDFKPEFSRQAFHYCLLGATDKQLASLFCVHVATINRWKLKFPEFCESLKRGKYIADAEVAEALYQKAIGYTRQEEKVFMYKGVATVFVVDVYYPPDTTAIIFWLKNRQPQYWRDRHQLCQADVIAHGDMDGDQLNRRLVELQDKLKQSQLV